MFEENSLTINFFFFVIEFDKILALSFSDDYCPYYNRFKLCKSFLLNEKQVQRYLINNLLLQQVPRYFVNSDTTTDISSTFFCQWPLRLRHFVNSQCTYVKIYCPVTFRIQSSYVSVSNFKWYFKTQLFEFDMHMAKLVHSNRADLSSNKTTISITTTPVTRKTGKYWRCENYAVLFTIRLSASQVSRNSSRPARRDWRS